MHLTNLTSLAMITLLLQKTEVGFRSSKNQGTRDVCRQVHVFFYVYLVMVGVLGGCKACRFLDPVFEPDMSATQCFEALAGGNSITIKEALMPDSNVAPLRPNNIPVPCNFPAANEPMPIDELVIRLPEFIETALSYILSDFDYENNISSNTAVGIRVLALTVDRLKDSLEALK